MDQYRQAVYLAKFYAKECTTSWDCPSPRTMANTCMYWKQKEEKVDCRGRQLPPIRHNRIPTAAPEERRLDREQAVKFGTGRETWCATESNARMSWMRAVRRHYPKYYISHVFDECPEYHESRCMWRVEKPVLAERRHHFPGRRTDYDHLSVYNIAIRRDTQKLM